MIGPVLLGALAFVIAISLLVVTARAREHRIDIPRGASMGEGKSRIWQANVLDPRNYDATGRRLVGWMWILQLALLICAVAFIACIPMLSV